MKTQMKVACFYEWTAVNQRNADILLIQGIDSKFDIVRTTPMAGEDDFTALNSVARSLGISGSGNFRQVASKDPNTIYYISKLIKPAEIGVLISPKDALIYNLSQGLAEVVRNLYIDNH